MPEPSSMLQSGKRTYAYVHIYIYVCVCMYIYICVYIYICSHNTSTSAGWVVCNSERVAFKCVTSRAMCVTRLVLACDKAHSYVWLICMCTITWGITLAHTNEGALEMTANDRERHRERETANERKTRETANERKTRETANERKTTQERKRKKECKRIKKSCITRHRQTTSVSVCVFVCVCDNES